MGRHNGLYRKFKAKNECLHLWLSLPFIHNTANHASKAFAEATGFDVGEFLVVFYYFDSSTKRQAMLKHFWEFRDQQYHRKFGATRWLSKEECINCILKQYPSLVSYSASQLEVRSDPRLK